MNCNILVYYIEFGTLDPETRYKNYVTNANILTKGYEMNKY